MDKERTLGVWFFAIQVALALWLYYAAKNRDAKMEIIAVPGNDEPDFAAPWGWTNPGIYPQAPGFQSVINVYADNPLAAGLAYQYMPIFGLVGFNYANF